MKLAIVFAALLATLATSTPVDVEARSPRWEVKTGIKLREPIWDGNPYRAPAEPVEARSPRWEVKTGIKPREPKWDNTPYGGEGETQ